jgi:WD40 repeat protein
MYRLAMENAPDTSMNRRTDILMRSTSLTMFMTHLSISLSLSIYLFHQRPILLKGHERSITVVKYNYDGDLLFTASKDHVPSVWRAEDGERLGTFNGHKGTIWDLDCDRFSHRLVTASADAYVVLMYSIR